MLNLIHGDESIEGKLAEHLEDNRAKNCTITYITYWHNKLLEICDIKRYEYALISLFILVLI